MNFSNSWRFGSIETKKRHHLGRCTWSWPRSTGGPPLRPLRMDPGEDGRVRTAPPQRTFGAVFPARARRRLRSSPAQIFPRISLENPNFGLGLPLWRGRRCDLRDAQPTASVPSLAWRTARAAACGHTPDQGLVPGPQGPKQCENSEPMLLNDLVRHEIPSLRQLNWLFIKRILGFIFSGESNRRNRRNPQQVESRNSPRTTSLTLFFSINTWW